ncbi:penicillin-binding protein 1C [Filimonas effusa]|uniref:penicillin-binding protein 1C n=1 Tax=Filimonas effusa TaxID=2508721 RepID=UPI001FE5448A|nr:penicillin-binding protein 1C [Filimonas effusa]
MLICFWFCLPSRLFTKPTSFVLTDKEGNLLNAAIASDGQWRFPYNKEVPEKFEKCIVAFEDKRFFYHPGVDALAIGRAVVQNLKGSRTVSGGSTLTMQVMRLSRGPHSRNIWNKMVEAIQAVRLECTHRKKTILALYASNAPFGSNVVGLDAAAWRYYGRNAAQLSWGEMAALAVLPNAPSVIHPGKNRTLLLNKRNALLEKLLANKTIDSTTCMLAMQEPLPGAPQALPQITPHLLERFKKIYYSHTDAYNSTGLQTTIDIQLQERVNMLLQQHHAALRGSQINNIAAMVVEVETGNVLTYTGNIYQPSDSSLESHVDVLAAPRSPGSTLKPILYASLLTEGRFLPRQLVPDIPTRFNGYTPQNFDLGYDGAVPANRALARSLNIPAVKMLQQYKYPRFYNVLKQCGITTLSHPADFYGMSLILGGCEVTPFELAGVYSSMARMYKHAAKNKGKWNSADWFMPKIDGRTTGDQAAEPEKEKTNEERANEGSLFDYPALWHMFNAMTEVMRPGEEGLWGLFGSAQRIAWKTGTSFGFRDGWAIGVTPKYCVVVWVGNTSGEGRPGLTGINTAAPVLFDIFRILPASQWFDPPQSGFIYLPICRQSGYKAGPDCLTADTMLVSASAINAAVCPYHRSIHLDKTGTYRVTANCESPADMQHPSWFVLPPTMEYYYKQHHTDYKPLPPFMPGCNAETNKPLELVYPEEGAVIFIPREISGEKGNTIFSATHRNANSVLYWHLDEQFVGTTRQFHKIALNPSEGPHTITVVDESGESVTRSFRVEGSR